MGAPGATVIPDAADTEERDLAQIAQAMRWELGDRAYSVAQAQSEAASRDGSPAHAQWEKIAAMLRP